MAVTSWQANMARGNTDESKNQINRLFNQYLGRNASQDELNAHLDYANTHAGEGYGVALGGLERQLQGSDEAQRYQQSKQIQGAKAQSSADYASRAPIRGQMYSDLQDQAMQILQQGNSALKHNLAGRGLMDSGSLGEGTTQLGLGAQKMVQQGANAINLEDLRGAQQAGAGYIDWERALMNQDKNFQNQKDLMYLNSIYNKPQDKGWWDYALEGVNAGASLYGAMKPGKQG